MLYIDTHNQTNPALNLALEEVLLRHHPAAEPLLLLYVNEPCVVLGRNQNIFEEINVPYTRAHNLLILRRLSGGGAVYHDLGNLNYSFLTPGRELFHQFETILTPVIQTLNQLGIPAVFQPSSHIFLHGKKISGNAQYSASKRLLTHGTILFDVDLTPLRQSLITRPDYITSRAVQSTRASVTNVRPYAPAGFSLEQLKMALLDTLAQTQPLQTAAPTAEQWQQAEQLAQEKYAHWSWNFGGGPPFTVHKTNLTAGGKSEVFLQINEGIIASAEITGEGLPAGLAEMIVNRPYDPDILAPLLATLAETAGVDTFHHLLF